MSKKLILMTFFILLIFPVIVIATDLKSCGSEWINIHKKNPDLIGVYVQQFPDCQGYRVKYKNKHPAMVIYVFKGSKAHQVEYTPTGQVQNGFWWDIPKGHIILEQISTDLKPDIDCHFSAE